MTQVALRLIVPAIWALSIFASVARPASFGQAPAHSPDHVSQTANVTASPEATETQGAQAQLLHPKRITAYTLPPDLYRKAKTLSHIRFSFRVFSFFYGLFALWFLLKRRFSARFRDWAEYATRHRGLQALIYTPLLALSIMILQLPLDLFNEWLLKRYGISVQSWPSWTGDWLKVLVLAALLGSLFAALLYTVIRHSPGRWWFYFWVLSLPIFLFLFFLEPYVIDPLFYEFQPLEAKAPELVPELQRVTQRAGMEVSPERMFWMRASDKTTYTNAYVTGFGASKRVVIWDTSLAKETTDGILTMFGHEMGHYALGHILKGLVFFSLTAFLLLYLGYCTISWLLARYANTWGVRALDDLASLPALLLLVSLFGSAAGVAGNAFSRYQEHQADIYSLEVTHGIVAEPGQASAVSFQRFGESVFADPDPNPIYVFLFFDHPPVDQRIHLLVTYDPWSQGRPPLFVK